jgi:GrpB-like predicted nucleotidyltransferase (UPF0157 family)
MSIFLETTRLILKTPELSDLNNLIILRADPDVMRYTGDGVQEQETVKEALNFFISYYHEHRMGFFSVFEKDSGDFIGQAGLFHLSFDDKQPEIEIAYRLHKQFWGKGYATELAKALVHWGFENLSKDKFIASCLPENIASQKVLQKAGLDFIRKIILEDGTEILRYEIYKNDAIELMPYDDKWPKLAALEIQHLCEVLSKQSIINIEHIGSTAIPHICAKPVIDIQIGVESLQAIKAPAIEALTQLGYVYWDENPDPTRLFFVKGMPPFGERRTHHVHIVEYDSDHWRDKILFRDYLRAHPDTAKEYEQLKNQLAKESTYDREKYTNDKLAFIQKILKLAENKISSV